jgi:hypothetical protein
MDYLSERLYRYSSWWSMLLAALLYGFFLSQVMVPHAATMQSFAGDWGAPDGHLFYTANELYTQIGTWSAEGRDHYVHFRLSLDPLWALTYTALLVTLISVALRRATKANDARRRLNLLPLVPMCADLLENTLGIILVTLSPERHDGLATLMGTVSLFKWVTLVFAHLVLLYALLLLGRAALSRN